MILIVGAGPTGLTAAVELARRGLVPTVIDRSDGPTPLSKAVGISPRSLDILEPSGVTARLLDRGIRIQRGCAHAVTRGRDRVLGTIELRAIPHRFPFLLSLPQSDTETAMAETLAEYGGSVAWQTRLTGIAVVDGVAEVVLDGPDGREERVYEHVFAADGAHSTAREALGIEFPGYEHDRRWSIADAAIEAWPHAAGAAHLFLHPGGDVGFIIPIGDERFRAVSNTPDALARIPGDYRITQRLRDDTFDIPVRQAVRYRCGGVFLGGDAAHVHSPVGARGMNLGIEDAACFARRLAEGELDGYEAERRPVGARWIRLSENVLATVQSTRPLVRWGRNLGLWVATRSPWLQRPALERLAGLKE